MINNSKTKPYYSQRNNAVEPSGSCNVTAMVQALVVAGWPLPSGAYKQPEDNLISFIRKDEFILKEWKRLDPKGKFPPNQWHALLCMGTNRWLLSAGVVGKKVITLTEDFTSLDFKSLIDAGGAAVFSGRFKSRFGILGHVVCGVGYAEAGGKISDVVLDDPWGDYKTLYRNQNGNDVLMPMRDFKKLLRPLGAEKKLAHIVPRFEKA